MIMERSIGAFEIRRELGRILQEVAADGDRYIVKRHGVPVAVVVPVEVYDQWKRGRESFFEALERAQAQADLTPAEADELAGEAVKAVRSETES